MIPKETVTKIVEDGYEQMASNTPQTQQMAVAAELLAMRALLMEKGVCTAEEIEAAVAQATAAIDQIHEEFMQRYRKEHPGIDLLNKIMGGRVP